MLRAVGAPTHAFSLSRPSTRADAVRQGALASRQPLGLQQMALLGHWHEGAGDRGLRHADVEGPTAPRSGWTARGRGRAEARADSTGETDRLRGRRHQGTCRDPRDRARCNLGPPLRGARPESSATSRGADAALRVSSAPAGPVRPNAAGCPNQRTTRSGARRRADRPVRRVFPRPLSTAFAGMPLPSSTTVSTTSWPACRTTSTVDTWPCRLALESASPDTASRSGTTAGLTWSASRTLEVTVGRNFRGDFLAAPLGHSGHLGLDVRGCLRQIQARRSSGGCP